MSRDSITFICQTGYKNGWKTVAEEKELIKKEIERCWALLQLPYKYNVYFFGDRIERKNNAFPGEIIRIIIITSKTTRGYFFPYFFVIDKPVKHICCFLANNKNPVPVGYFQTSKFYERLYSELYDNDMSDLSQVLKKIQNFKFTAEDSEDYNLQKAKVLVYLEPGIRAAYATNDDRIKPSNEWGYSDIFEPFVSHLSVIDRISWDKDIHKMNSNSVTARLKFYIFEMNDTHNLEDDIVQFIKSYVGSPDACAGLNILILMNCNEKIEFKTLTTFFGGRIYFKVSCEKKYNTLDAWTWTVAGSYTDKSIKQIIKNSDEMSVRSSEKNKELFDLLYSHKFSENKRSLKKTCETHVCRYVNVYTKKELTDMKAFDFIENYKFTDLIHFAEYLIKYSFVENLINAYKRDFIKEIRYDDASANEFKNEFKRTFKPPKFVMKDDSKFAMPYENISGLLQDKSYKINYNSIERDIKQNKLTGNPNMIKQLMGNQVKSIQGGTGKENTTNEIAVKDMKDQISTVMREGANVLQKAMENYSTNEFDEKMYACKQYIISSICNSLELCGHFIFVNINIYTTYYFVERIKEEEIWFLTQSDAFAYNIPYANHYIYFIFKHDYMKYALLYISQYAYKVDDNRQIKLTGFEYKYIERNPLMTKKEQRVEEKQIFLERNKGRVSEEQIAEEFNYINNDRSYGDLFSRTAYRFNDIDELEFIVNSIKLDNKERKYIIIFFLLSDENQNKTELLNFLCMIANGDMAINNETFVTFMSDVMGTDLFEKIQQPLAIMGTPVIESVPPVIESVPPVTKSQATIEEITEGGNQNSRMNVIIIVLFFVLLMYCYVRDKTKKHDVYFQGIELNLLNNCRP